MGSNQNATKSGVRIICLITGLSAEGRNQRDQPQNQKAAFWRLVEKLIEYYRKEELASVIKDKAPSTAIRTYKEKNSLVIDHRTGAKYNYNQVLGGKLDPIMEDLLLNQEKVLDKAN